MRIRRPKSRIRTGIHRLGFGNAPKGEQQGTCHRHTLAASAEWALQAFRLNLGCVGHLKMSLLLET